MPIELDVKRLKVMKYATELVSRGLRVLVVHQTFSNEPLEDYLGATVSFLDINRIQTKQISEYEQTVISDLISTFTFSALKLGGTLRFVTEHLHLDSPELDNKNADDCSLDLNSHFHCAFASKDLSSYYNVETTDLVILFPN